MIAAIYFSPTDTSRKGAEAIAKALGDGEFLSIDVTRFDAEPERTEFGPEDAVVFGAPVYGGRLYRGCRERFRRFRGNGTPCIVTVTYGNRDYDDALLELFDLAREQGFVPAAAAALVGQHTYGSIQVGRPDASDLAQDREFAEKAAAGVRAKKALETVPGSRPYVKGDEGGRGGNFRPRTRTGASPASGASAAAPWAPRIWTSPPTGNSRRISRRNCRRAGKMNISCRTSRLSAASARLGGGTVSKFCDRFPA